MLFNELMKTVEQIRDGNLHALAAKHGGPTAFAILLGKDISQVSQWLNKSIDFKTGKPRNISARSCRQIEAKLGLPVGWMDTQHAAEAELLFSRSGGESKEFDVNVRPVPIGVREIPVISAIQAGKLKEISDPYPPGAGFARVFTDDMNLSQWTFALEIEGDSMLPVFVEGDRVIIDPEMTPNPGEYVAARNSHAEATFKRYRPRGIDKSGNEIFELVPLNEDYPTMRSDSEPLQIIGTMAYHIRRGRKRK